MAANGVARLVVIFLLTLHSVDRSHCIPRISQREIYDEVRQLLALSPNTISKNDELQEDSSELSEIADSKPDVPKAVKNWPQEDLNLGQVSGVAVNSKLQPVVFHRADRVWDENTFNDTHYYQQQHLGPIKDDTILTLNPKTGAIIGRWGANLFFLPHGLTIDRHNNLWVTDVALHQAFKFRPGDDYPSLSFGIPFQPGTGIRHLCKPTSIAVASTGEIFIADGYCNSRILKYNAAGGLLRVIPNPPEFLSLVVPHGLALIEPLDRLCVADRENMRVTCPRAGLYSTKGETEPALTIQQPDMGRVFGVAAKGNLVYAVNGPTSFLLPVQGMTIDPQSETVIDHWAPEEIPQGKISTFFSKLKQALFGSSKSKGFGNPHAIAVCPNGSALYVAEIGPNKIWKFELVPPKKKK